MTDNVWTIIGEETVFEAEPFVTVKRQHLVTSAGQTVCDYYQVVLPDFVMLCPMTEQRHIITLWQYKHGSRKYGLTFPAGQIDPSESAEAAARRELVEETGYRAGSVQFLGSCAVSGNQGCGFAHMFLVGDCIQVSEPNWGDLETMDLKLMSVADVEAAIRAGAISVLPHLALWGLARANGFGSVYATPK